MNNKPYWKSKWFWYGVRIGGIQGFSIGMIVLSCLLLISSVSNIINYTPHDIFMHVKAVAGLVGVILASYLYIQGPKYIEYHHKPDETEE